MTELEVIGIIREALRVASVIAFPLLVSALLAGLTIGLLQALTSIQEMTLTFVPKLGVIVMVLWATMGSTVRHLTTLFDNNVINIIAGG